MQITALNFIVRQSGMDAEEFPPAARFEMLQPATARLRTNPRGHFLEVEEGGVGMPNPSIKNEKLYEDLRTEGNSKQKSARIANAVAARGKSAVGKKGGKSGSYDDWTVTDLKKRAKEIGLSGYSKLSKDKLISRIRNS